MWSASVSRSLRLLIISRFHFRTDSVRFLFLLQLCEEFDKSPSRRIEVDAKAEMISVQDAEDLNIKLVSERAKVREVCLAVPSETLAYTCFRCCYCTRVSCAGAANSLTPLPLLVTHAKGDELWFSFMLALSLMLVG